MLSRILVPLDGSELAERVLGHVQRILPGGGGEVVLARVLEERPLRDEAAAAARADLERLGAGFEGRAAVTRLVAGDPAERILELAGEHEPDLIALATHGRTGLLRLLRGSTAERLLARSRHPLFLATPASLPFKGAAPEPFRRVLVPVDGSWRAERVLPLAGAFANAHGAEVLLLHVTERPDPGTCERILGSARRHLEADRCRLVTAVGTPAAKILDVAREERADLLAMTTHGQSPASRWLFGSTADSVLHLARSPLLVVRPPD